MRASVHDWLTKASLDLEAAQKNHDAGLHAWAVHIARQAAEFALKAAWQHVRHEAAPAHHRVRDLGASLGREVPAAVDQALHQLAPHYILTRYPDAGLGIPDYHYGPADSEAAISNAREVVAWVQSLVSSSE